MARKRHFKSKAPLDSLDDSRAFIARLSPAFARCEDGVGAEYVFSEFIASLGYFPVDGDQWSSLRDSFIKVATLPALSPEEKTARLMTKDCPWLESDFVRSVRASEKRPAPRDGKQPPIPSPFSR
jgi:hypothetical protein